MRQEVEKFDLQDTLYSEPYHHFVSFRNNDPRYYALLSWGIEYYGYVGRVLEIAAEIKFDRVAEVGCGDGKVIYELAKRFPGASHEGYDLSEKAIAFASAYGFGTERLAFFARDFAEAAGAYDLILCVETLEHIPDDHMESFLKTMHEKLALGGRLIVSVPTLNRPVSAKHYRHYDESVLSAHTDLLFETIHTEFVHRHSSIGYRFLEAILSNRFYILNVRRLRKILFALYVRRYRSAPANIGTHLIAVLKKK
jgi:2-polyprenyl-3-methyl-5-hydroxy-6-metoxy-1,4-benzoquinol methylase